ncbi:response regulator [Candidatus Liberibacter solanacearum]|uniref:response regulator n=1 Tax=Candidatus Liberibacter solanacearum TaxID=556287 RepID=UPI001FE0C6E8|nr:response regulator [Candidatus Liberibacter solanacearum]
MSAENIPLKSDVLIVNGEKDISNMIASMLQARGYAVHISCNLDSAFAEMAHYMPRFILLDIQMVGYLGNSLAFLDKMKEIYPDILVLMISDQENIDMSISSIKAWSF